MVEPRYLLPVWETIQTGWEKKNGVKGTIWLALIIIIVISIGGNYVTSIVEKTSPLFGGLLNFILQVFIFLLTAGLYYLGTCVAFDKPVDYSFMFRSLQTPYNYRLIIVYILLSLIFFVCFIIGFVPVVAAPQAALITIPLAVIAVLIAIFITIRLSIALLFVLPGESGAIEAIKLSWKATRGNFWRIVWLMFLMVIFTIISAIPLGIGLIWTLPWAYVTFGVLYKNLLANLPADIVPKPPV